MKVRMEMKGIFKHIVGQPFVFATVLAALVHSTWALGTLFSGQQPEGWHLVGWLIPALLIAFALDIGQIVTSWEIREHGLTVGRGVTFFVFAAATYYLQWLYIAHHMPALDIAAGVSATAKGTAIYMRDAALWIIPSFLPLSTVLYTFSGKTSPTAPKMEEKPQIQIQPVEAPPPEMLPQLEESVGTPFGGNLPTGDGLESGEPTEGMLMIESAREPIVSVNGKKPTKRRIQKKE